MPVTAIIFNIIFVLAAWETVRNSRKIGFGNIRFLTSSKKTTYALILVGAALCAGMTAVAGYAILGGTVDEFCRRCVRISFSYASNPLYYLLTIAAILECAAMGVLMMLMARNSLRYIREQ
jgi:ABC-type dipeptide/oligopeptide/nickel transport system permease subunit